MRVGELQASKLEKTDYYATHSLPGTPVPIFPFIVVLEWEEEVTDYLTTPMAILTREQIYTIFSRENRTTSNLL